MSSSAPTQASSAPNPSGGCLSLLQSVLDRPPPGIEGTRAPKSASARVLSSRYLEKRMHEYLIPGRRLAG
jgi:hypothetical protein